MTQIDLPDSRRSGLLEVMKVLRHINGISLIHFNEKDVVRHHLVQEIIKAYEKYYEEGKRAK